LRLVRLRLPPQSLRRQIPRRQRLQRALRQGALRQDAVDAAALVPPQARQPAEEEARHLPLLCRRIAA
jgi:hypothetical protein